VRRDYPLKIIEKHNKKRQREWNRINKAKIKRTRVVEKDAGCFDNRFCKKTPNIIFVA
jgi:hypothetical protein